MLKSFQDENSQMLMEFIRVSQRNNSLVFVLPEQLLGATLLQYGMDENGPPDDLIDFIRFHWTVCFNLI